MLIIGSIPPYFFHSSMMNHYNFQYVKTHNLIKKTKGDERIILVGGSNLAFGVDSKLISDSLSLRVINFGVHAGIGLKKPLLDLKNYLTEKDVVIVIPEFETYDLDFYEKELYTIEYMQSKTLISSLKLSVKDYIKSIKTNYPRMLKYFLRSYFKNNKMLSSGYNINQFNEQGDYIIIDEKRNGQIKFDYKTEIPISIIMKLKNKIQTDYSKVKLFIAPPPTLRKSMDNLRFSDYNQLMKKSFGSRYICCLEDFSLNDKQFLDTKYHLTTEGKTIRTKALIKVLKEKLN